MSAAADTFGRFVDLVAEALDGAGTMDAAELAARAHLSRSHFDRLVSAVAGETPGAFRRRVLLERSAYRLVSSQRGILDIAVEAGYGSHEAFTRSFARAYGVPPSRWRRHPGPRLALDAPSDVHFYPPGGLRVPARRKVTSMDLLQSMVAHHLWLLDEILDRAARLDDEVLDRRIDISVEYLSDAPTLRSELSRLVGQLAMWDAATDGRQYDFAVERDESLLSMRRRLAEAGPRYRRLVAQLVEQDRLDETFIDASSGPPEVFTYGGMLAHVLTFGATRRTVVIGALMSAGQGDLGAGDPIRWVGSTG